MTNLGLKTLNVVPCYCHYTLATIWETLNTISLSICRTMCESGHLLAHWLTHFLAETFLPTVLLLERGDLTTSSRHTKRSPQEKISWSLQGAHQGRNDPLPSSGSFRKQKGRWCRSNGTYGGSDEAWDETYRVKMMEIDRLDGPRSGLITGNIVIITKLKFFVPK
ncbi:hypothetical protein TNCT_409481 [Trichonephila clavata]|uniref:Uncharacterized protein n=1 Tax=Trichonephila clavata TaxID=2740835 RepID=A0A8X6KX60_TRICU|nr:hypothetical protein TNCT_409481 [Trichonephila clavata]